MRFIVVLILIVAVQTSIDASETKQPKPLFQSNEILEMQLDFSMRAVAKRQLGTDGEIEGKLTLLGDEEQTFDIKITLRGNSRQKEEICDFPPIKLDFKKKQVKGTVFHGQNKLKLVTYCNKRSRYERYSLREFMTYRFLNQLTDLSYKVRMVEVTYNDSHNRMRDVKSYEFLIEDVDDLADRNDLIEVDRGSINKPDVEPEHSALISLYQYMIGNLDWSILSGPDGEDCCHNARLLQAKDETGPFIPVIYDFDYSGLVNASYARAPKNAKVSSVRERRYRGFCLFNDKIPAAITKFNKAKTEIYAVIEEVPWLSKSSRKGTADYLDEFYAVINDPNSLKEEIYDHCRD